MKKNTRAKKQKSSASKESSAESMKTIISSENSRDKKDFLVVGLGASAGGVKALQEFFAAMPSDSGMAFVVVLHLSPQHESNLAEILQTQTTMPVVQVSKTYKVEPNHVYVIPPNRGLKMVDGVVKTDEPERPLGHRVVIDLFFRTLANAYERNAVCVILSGTGADGTLGLKHIKESNGFAIVQSPEDAEYDGMPRSAIATNLADWILPVNQMPEKLIAFRDSSERLHLTGGDDGKVAKEIQADESLREILTLLRVRTGHDFSNYKTPTLVRRVARHLQIHELEDIPSYLTLLRENPHEIQSLQRNLLINVTNFFRDKEAFDALEKSIIPQVFENKTSRDTVRVWSAGCASGEEAFSLGILLHEFASRLSDPPKIQIFATDVDDEAINEARAHRYPESILADVSPERLKKFFVKEGNFYRICKELRETVLFAPHNILRDPPFSRLDLISCRNLLIYLNRETQNRVMEIFHFALTSNSFLFLGSSESAENVSQLFLPVDKKHRIYSRKSAQIQSLTAPPLMPVMGNWQVDLPKIKTKEEREKAVSVGEVHYKLLEKFAPPSVLVNRDFEIMYMSESIGRYLRFQGGEPSNNLLKLIHPDLLPDLRAALFTAQREQKSSEFPRIRMRLQGKETLVNLFVRAVDVSEEGQEFLLVIFSESGEGITPHSVVTEDEPDVQILNKDDAMETVVRRLEEDLVRTKSQLRATIEQHEVSIEELKASNEELQAINEELRSASEELETSKEELQSVNEELITVNHELKDKIEEVSHTNSDLQNLMAATDIATIFLDRHLQIKRYTPPVQEIFNITPSDIGRPLEHFTHRLNYDNLAEDATQVLRSLITLEREISDKNKHRYLARFAPYRTIDDRIDGVVLNFIDITVRKNSEAAVSESEEKFRTFLDTVSDVIYQMSADWREMRLLVGKEFIVTTENPREDWMEEYIPEDERLNVWTAINKAIETKSPFELEHRIIRLDGTIGWTFSRAVPILNEKGEIIEWFGAASDITTRKKAEETVRESKEHLQLILKSIHDYAIITTDENYIINGWNTGAENIFGWTAQEAVGKSCEILFTPEDLKAKIPEKQIRIALKKGFVEDERYLIRKDGRRFVGSGVKTPILNSQFEGFVKVIRDQTEKIAADKIIQEKETLRLLVSAQEDERRRIARDIHDQLGQQLTALRLKIENLKKEPNNKTAKYIEEVEKIVGELDVEVDFIAWELRPASLDDLSLRLTLQNFVREWSHHTNIKSDFHSTGLTKAKLNTEVETNLYRITQEALNNVYKHSEAQTVSVILDKRADKIVLIIEDDGKGFNTKDKKTLQQGIGLIGMKERTKIIGGEFEIESKKGKGTTVFVRLTIK